jgi:hypothetical protein
MNTASILKREDETEENNPKPETETGHQLNNQLRKPTPDHDGNSGVSLP